MSPEPLSSRAIFSRLAASWAGAVLLALAEHLFGGLVPVGRGSLAVLSSAALGGLLFLLGLSLLVWLLRRVIVRFDTHLLYRVEVAFCFFFWVWAAWCLLEYLRDPRLPLHNPHPLLYALGALPSLLVGLFVFWKSRRPAQERHRHLLVRFAYLLLSFLGLLWVTQLNYFWMQNVLGGVLLCWVWGLSRFWIESERRRRLVVTLGVFLLVGSLVGGYWLRSSYWARDAASRGGRLSLSSLRLASPLLLGEHNGLARLAKGAFTPRPTSQSTLPSEEKRLRDTQPKNLLLITIDCLRRDLGGLALEFPALERLQREGVVFQNHRSSAANTTEAMPGLFLGQYVWAPQKTKSLFALAHDAGFYTLAILSGSYLLLHGNEWLREGIDTLDYRFKPPFLAASISEQMTERFLQRLDKAKGEPFVAWLHYNDPHDPYDAEGETERERYANEVLRNDRALQALLDGLESRGFLQNTMIVLSADHGEQLDEEHTGATHGLTLYEEILQVPLVIRAPGGAVTGTITAPTSSVDLAPSLLSVMGIPRPLDFAPYGQSLFSSSLEREVFAFRKMSSDGEAAVVRGQYKLIYSVRTQSAQLYDLSSDPKETQNLIAERPELAASLAASLLRLVEEGGLALP